MYLSSHLSATYLWTIQKNKSVEKRMTPYPLHISFLTGLLLLLLGSSLRAQEMYPGDVNNNGEVNGVDVLYLGLAIGAAEGPERPDATTAFIPQAFTFWGQTFPDGLDYGYADCDGDGEIDEEDFEEGLIPNFGETAPAPGPDDFSSEGAPGFDPMLKGTADLPTAGGGQEVNIAFTLGDEDTEVLNFHGLTFKLRFDPALFETDDDDDPEYQIPNNNWYGLPNETLRFSEVDLETGEVTVAIVRKGMTTVNGHGSIGTFTFVIIEDVVDAIAVDTLIEISDVRVSDGMLTTIPVAMDTAGAVSTREVNRASTLRVYPNPAREHLTVRSQEAPIRRLQMRNALGQAVPITAATGSEQQKTLSTRGLPGGWYTLEVWTDERQMTVEKVYLIDK